MPDPGVVVDLLTDSPLLAALVAAIMRAGLAWQRGLSWYEYRTLHGLRRLLFPTLDRVTPFKSFVNPKGGRTDAEYLVTLDRSVRSVVGDLRDGGGSLHLLSSVKRRPPDHGDPLSRAHVVWTHGADQTEAYLFHNDDGTTDVYAHHEGSVVNPVDHLAGGQQDGDPHGVVRAALGLDSS